MSRFPYRAIPLALAGALLLLGCAEQKAPPSSPSPAAQVGPPPPSAGDLLVQKMEQLSERADDPDLTDEQADQTTKDMDAALQEYFHLPDPVRADPKVQGALSRMCDMALQLELDANSAPETPDTGTSEAPTEDLLRATTFLSPEDLKSTYATVQKALEQVNLGFQVEPNDAILAYVKTFQTKLHDWFARALARGAPYVPKMQQIFKDEGIPPSLVYLAIVESAFNPNAVSRARAVGMWQFIAGTAQRYGLVVDFWEDQRRDPELAARAAARYLKDLHEMFGDWQFALAAYNCGEGKIQRYQDRHPDSDPDFWKLRKSRYLRRETREYVPAIMAAILLANNPAAYGFDPATAAAPPSETATVTIPESTDMRVLAKCADVSVEELQALNPSLKRLMTPPRPFALHIPARDVEGFQARLDAVPADERVTVAMHTVERGENLRGIARQYKTSQEAIRLANRLRSHYVKVGQSLVIPLGQAASDPSLYAEETRGSRGGARVYKVRRGDTLSSIARRTGTSVDALRSLNDLEGSALKPGQRLVLGEPSAGPRVARTGARHEGPSAPHGKPRIHHVRQGDTLWDLARKYGTTVDRICRANRISPGHRLNLGDSLVIP